MKFQYPGWGIGWFTPLLVIFTPVIAYGSYTDGSISLALYWLSVSLFSALTWFQQRWVAIPLVIYFLFDALDTTMSIADNGFSFDLAGRLGFICGGTYELVSWYRVDAAGTLDDLDSGGIS